MHACAGDGLVHVKQSLTLAEAVNQDVHRAAVKTVSAQPQQVVEQTRDFCVHDTYVLSAHRHIHAHHLFDGQAIRVFIGHHRHIVKAVHVGQRLDVGLAFSELFCSAVQQTDVRIGALDNFTVELQHQAQHAVRGRVLGTKIERVVFDFCHVFCLKPWGRGRRSGLLGSRAV